MSDTPVTDVAERFMHSGPGKSFGFISSELGRKLERDLNAATLALKLAGPGPGKAVLGGGRPPEGASDTQAVVNAKTPPVGSTAPAQSKVVASDRKEPGSASPSTAGRAIPAVQASAVSPAAGVAGVAGVASVASVASEAPAQRAPAEDAGDFVEYAPGDVLFNKGEPANHMAVIIGGSVEIFDPEHNRQIAVIGKGNFFGEQAILRGGVRGASVRALDTVTCLEIKTENLRTLLSADGGVLMPGIEALLLQLGVVNGIVRVVKTPGAERVFEVIDHLKLTAVQGRKALSHAFDKEEHGLSSDQMLFLKLQSSEKLQTSLFSPGQQLGSVGEAQTGLGFVILDGHVDAVKGDLSVRLGVGSVIGVAEGFANSPLLMSYAAVENVTALILPMDQVLRGFDNANAGIKAISRYTAARVIELEQSL